MRVTVDDDQCKGHGVCWSLCPEVFDLNDDGYAVAITTDVPEQFVQVVRTAEAQCPERAIRIIDR